MKLNINSPETGPNQPPSLTVGSLDIEEDQISSEADMVKRIFAEYGSGRYLVQVNQPPKNQYHNVWRGDIEVESADTLLFEAELNVLEMLTPLSSKKPHTDQLKRVSVPTDARGKAAAELPEEKPVR